jgi:very-short-patch-repair endonuclease
MRLTEAEYAELLARRGATTKPAPAPKKTNRGEAALAALLDAAVIPYTREFKFLPDRKFRFDFVLLPLCMKLAVEIDGAVHRIDSRWRADREKSNLALANGWRVLHLGVDQVSQGDNLELVRGALLQPAMRTLQAHAIDDRKIPA